jgi:hypothetical protein
MNKNDINEKPASCQIAVTGSRFVPMVMSTPMVVTILNGTKTETRRIVKPQPDYFLNCVNGKPQPIELKSGISQFFAVVTDEMDVTNDKCIYPKVNVNDIIWVRETFNLHSDLPEIGPEYWYKADNEIYPGIKWKPPLFMTKEACRIFLKVVDVKVERLKDIDEESAIKEGIERLKPDGLLSFRSYAVKYDACVFPIVSYQTLWQKINGKESWDENPFVWVYKFEVVERPHDFL